MSKKPTSIAHGGIVFAVTDYQTARSELNFSTSADWTHCISIGDPGSKRAASSRRMGASLLRLEFDDVTLENVAHWQIVTEVQIESIVTFAQRLPPGARVLVHCQMGVSRSAAAAAILLMARTPGMCQSAALALVRQSRPQADPNSYMLWLYLNLVARRAL